MKKYRNYSDDDIIERAKIVTSMSGLLIELNLKPVGGNFDNMRKNLARLNIDTSHWTGQGWNIARQLKDFINYKNNTRLKGHIKVKQGHNCKTCKLTEWRGKPIMLELNHIDGDRTNNEETNLELLCPNCHAQTPHWRGRKTDFVW